MMGVMDTLPMPSTLADPPRSWENLLELAEQVSLVAHASCGSGVEEKFGG